MDPAGRAAPVGFAAGMSTPVFVHRWVWWPILSVTRLSANPGLLATGWPNALKNNISGAGMSDSSSTCTGTRPDRRIDLAIREDGAAPR